MTDYEIWHDENKGKSSVNEYWHGILFVPLNKKKDIIELLKKIRDEHKCSYDNNNLKFSGCLKKSQRGRIIANNLSLFSHLLITKQTGISTKIYNRSGRDSFRKKFSHFLEINDLFGCKFALLQIPDNHKNFDKYPMTYPERVETTFRFVFMGSMHLFFSAANPINIKEFCFDGHEHHGNGISLNRITKGELRDYCNIDKTCYIDDRQLHDRDINSAIMMLFVDNIIGAWVAKIQNWENSEKVSYPINGIYERLRDNGIIRNKNSRWYNSISVSKLEIIDGEIKFPNFFQNCLQQSLFS